MSGRRGFTLVELLVVVVLGTVVVMASLQILITNQRTYTAQNAKIQGQQTTRAALDLLSSELREISAQGGDLLAMGADSLTIRTMRKFGVTCAVDFTAQPKLTVIRVGDWFTTNDSTFVFADNNVTMAGDDVWLSTKVTAVDTTKFCASQSAQELTFTGQSTLFTNDTVLVGASIRSFERYTYGLYQINGESYLGRRTTGSAVPVVGPVKSSNGVAFSYLDGNGATTTVAADVRQILVTIRTASGVLGAGNQPVSDSITARIYTRN